MARVTVEDCLENVDNRFELVLVASKRARQLANGKPPMVEWENDKVTVVALREIAEGHITASILTEVEVEESEEEFLMEGQAPMTDGESSVTTELSSDELLASQVEALLSASNDILGGVAPVEEAGVESAEPQANVADEVPAEKASSENDNSGFSANLLNSAFMKSDNAATSSTETIEPASTNGDSEAGESETP